MKQCLVNQLGTQAHEASTLMPEVKEELQLLGGITTATSFLSSPDTCCDTRAGPLPTSLPERISSFKVPPLPISFLKANRLKVTYT
jgi:hypothetical protein